MKPRGNNLQPESKKSFLSVDQRKLGAALEALSSAGIPAFVVPVEQAVKSDTEPGETIPELNFVVFDEIVQFAAEQGIVRSMAAKYWKSLVRTAEHHINAHTVSSLKEFIVTDPETSLGYMQVVPDNDPKLIIDEVEKLQGFGVSVIDTRGNGCAAFYITSSAEHSKPIQLFNVTEELYGRQITYKLLPDNLARLKQEVGSLHEVISDLRTANFFESFLDYRADKAESDQSSSNQA